MIPSAPVLRPACERVRTALSVGPLRLSLELDPRLAPTLDALLAGYVSSAQDPWARTPRAVHLALDLARMRGDEPRQPRFTPDARGALHASCAAWHGRLERAGEDLHATFALADPSALPDALRAQWQPVMLAAALASALRATLAFAAPLAGGLLLHAAAIVAPSGRAFVLCGPSGEGKTTMTRRLHPWRVLADDAVLVFADAAGWRVAGTPLRGREDLPRRAESAPIARLCHLERGAALALTARSEASAFSALLPRVFWFAAPDARLADIAKTLVSELPSHTLGSRLEDDVVPLLVAAQGA